MTVASYHKDRELEVLSVGKSKQLSDKVQKDIFIKDPTEKREVTKKVQHNYVARQELK